MLNNYQKLFHYICVLYRKKFAFSQFPLFTQKKSVWPEVLDI